MRILEKGEIDNTENKNRCCFTKFQSYIIAYIDNIYYNLLFAFLIGKSNIEKNNEY